MAGNVMNSEAVVPAAKGTDANTVGLHFLGETFRQEEIKNLCCGVSRNVGDSLEGDRRGHDQDVASPARDHLRQEKTREMNDRGAVSPAPCPEGAAGRRKEARRTVRNLRCDEEGRRRFPFPW